MLDMPPEIEDAGVNASPSVSTSAKKPQGILRVSKHGGKPKQQTPVAQSTITGKMNEKLKRKMSQKKMDITDGTSDMSSDEDRSRSSSDHSRNSAQSAYWGSSSHSSEEAHRALHDSSDENSSQSSENSFAVEELSDLLEIPSTKLKSDNNTRQEPTPTGEDPIEADEAPPDRRKTPARSRSLFAVSRPATTGPVRTPSRSNLKRSSSYSASDARNSLAPLGTPKKSALKSNSNHNRDMEKNRPELEGILKDYYYNENNVLVPREKVLEPKEEETSSKDRHRSLSKQRRRRAGRRPSRASTQSQEGEDASLESSPSLDESLSRQGSSIPQSAPNDEEEGDVDQESSGVPAMANDPYMDDPCSSSDEEAHSGRSFGGRPGRRRSSTCNDSASSSPSDDNLREPPSPGSSSEDETPSAPSTIKQNFSSRDRVRRQENDLGRSFSFEMNDEGLTRGKEDGEEQTPQHEVFSRQHSSRDLNGSSNDRFSRDSGNSRGGSSRNRFDRGSLDDDHSQANGSFCFKTKGFGDDDDDDDDESISLQSEKTENRQDDDESIHSKGPEAAFATSRASGATTLIIGTPDAHSGSQASPKKTSEEEDVMSYASKGPQAAFAAVRDYDHRPDRSEIPANISQSAMIASSRDNKKYHSSFSFENPMELNVEKDSDEESIQLDELMIVNDLEPGTPSSMSVDSDRAVGSIPIGLPLAKNATKDFAPAQENSFHDSHDPLSERKTEVSKHDEATSSGDGVQKATHVKDTRKDDEINQNLQPVANVTAESFDAKDSMSKAKRSNSLVRRHSTEDLSSSKKWESDDTLGDLPNSSQNEPSSRVPPRRTQSARAQSSSSPGSSQPKSILRVPTFSSPEMRRQMEFRKQQSFKNKKSNAPKQDSIVDEASNKDTSTESVSPLHNTESSNNENAESRVLQEDEKEKASQDLAVAMAETREKVREKYLNASSLDSEQKRPLSKQYSSEELPGTPESGSLPVTTREDALPKKDSSSNVAVPSGESSVREDELDEWKFDLSAMEETQQNIEAVKHENEKNISSNREKMAGNQPEILSSELDKEAERMAKKEQLRAEADALQHSIQAAEKEAKANAKAAAKAAKKAAKKEKKLKKERKKKLKTLKKQKSRSSRGTASLVESRADHSLSSRGTQPKVDTSHQSFSSRGSDSKRSEMFDDSYSSRDTESGKETHFDHSFSSQNTESKMNQSYSSRGAESKMNNSYSSRDSKSKDTSAWSFSVTSDAYGGGSNSSISLSSDMPGLTGEKRLLLEKRREERARRLEKAKQRIRQKEEKEKQRKAAEMSDRSKVKATKILTDEERIERAYNWYSRCGMPSRKRMKERIKKIDGCDITEADVDLLPWLRGGRVVDAGRAMKISQSRRKLLKS